MKIYRPAFQLFFLFFVATGSLKAQHVARLIAGWQFLRQELGGIWECERDIGKANAGSVPAWDSVSLPHCFNSRDAVDPDVDYYQGPGWYRTLLEVRNPYSKGRTVLHFEGAGQKTEVYIYTTKVGSHVGGYDEWTVDLTNAIEKFRNDTVARQFKGKIPLSIRCDNSRDLEMIPSNLSDFNLYGGIYRYLDLVYVPSVSLDKMFALPEVDSLGKTGKLHIKTRFYNPLNVNTATISIRLIDPLGNRIQQTEKKLTNLNGDISIAEFHIKSPQLWSTEKPQLYTVEATVTTKEGVFSQAEKVGFRHFTFADHGPFFLNGKRLLIQGTQRHEDAAGVAAAMTEDMIRQEMIMIKEMGANFIRLAHYQQSPIVLHLCDSLGMLVWEEIPWCRGGLGGETYRQQARRMLTHMVEQHYNHPSVILWGLGNENDWPGDQPGFDKEKIRAFMKELNQLAHKLDPSRKTCIRRCDFCKDIVDVYSPSIWAGWYRGIYTEYKQVTEEEFKKVDHFLHMEWGGDSHAGRHSENPDKALQNIKATGSADERSGDALLFGGAARVSKDGDWSESYICNLFDWHLKEQETMPWLTGAAQWIFRDFSTPSRPDNPVPYVNQKGLIERDGRKKEGYYVFQSYWTAKPMVHIYGHSWPVRWGEEGEQKMVKVYSNCDEAELFVNGKSYGLKKRNSQDFPAAGLRWNAVFNKGGNKVLVVGRVSKSNRKLGSSPRLGVEVRDSMTFQYQTEKWGKPSKLLIEKINEESGVATIQAKLLDNKDVQCLDASNWIRFGLTGDGELIDDLGTSSGSRYVQMYNGRAVIRVKTKNGKSVVSAHVDTTPTAFINL
jgi:beta-galactosidase